MTAPTLGGHLDLDSSCTSLFQKVDQHSITFGSVTVWRLPWHGLNLFRPSIDLPGLMKPVGLYPLSACHRAGPIWPPMYYVPKGQ